MRSISLGSFGDIAQPPQTSDVEVVVCFSDLRGFTHYCNQLQTASLDSRIQNFLKSYFRIYAMGVLEEIWRLEPPDADETLTDEQAQLRRIIVPVTYKNLGDGVMLVWEIPQDTRPLIQGKATHRIMHIVSHIIDNFEQLFQKPGVVEIDAYSELVKDLRLGFGLARGHAWKLNFGHHLKFDYAGSVVNLAARLQDRARPDGVVCQYNFSQSLLERMLKRNIGKTEEISDLHGLGPQKVMVLSCDDMRNYRRKLEDF